MPRVIYSKDFDLSVDEFLTLCSSSDKDELIHALTVDGYIDNITNNHRRISIPEKMFEESLNTLHGNWNKLTMEEEETIINIAKRFK